MGAVNRFRPCIRWFIALFSLCNFHSTTCMTQISLECVHFIYSLVSSDLKTDMCATSGGSKLMGPRQRHLRYGTPRDMIMILDHIRRQPTCIFAATWIAI